MRRLYDWEMDAARTVFGESIRYARVRIHEAVSWPNTLFHFGQRVRGCRCEPECVNAVAIGYHCFFPLRLPVDPPQAAAQEDAYVAWLVHELAHVWQFERCGPRYITQALRAHLCLGSAVYALDAPPSLRFKRSIGWTLLDLNPEQQGSLAETWYLARRSPETAPEFLVAARPYIEDFQRF
ncbi:MAG TPA: hypothetical protein VK445_00165 [Dissulfurispiraceae bacterium]|nr:hypothetical protein [Dissulfurispiraceae bacterium]